MTIRIEDVVRAADAGSVRELLPGRPRVLAPGEPTHGENALLGLRNELFRQLVEQEGYRTIASESDCLMGLVVDDYVTSGTGALDEVVERGFSHGWGAFAANREPVCWMREYSDGRPVSERLRFAGFDGPLEISGAASPRQALTALHGYLAARVAPDLLPCASEALDRLLGADDRWTRPTVMMEPARSVGRSAEAGELLLLADDLVALLDAETPHLIAATSRDDWDRARLHGRTATGLLRYHYWLAGTSPGRMTRLLGQRDRMMADHLLSRRTGPGPGLRPQQPSPAAQEHDAHVGPAAAEMVERRRARERLPGREVRLPGHGSRHHPPPGSGHPVPGHRRGSAVRAPSGPLPHRRPPAGRPPRLCCSIAESDAAPSTGRRERASRGSGPAPAGPSRTRCVPLPRIEQQSPPRLCCAITRRDDAVPIRPSERVADAGRPGAAEP
ncbi:erythromycin esterase family protein [Streptomyces sp. KMM 9044]|uniref:erythromycin esterase family protein n=1 Tax=Streptomyces sp. KMM 9044 TaxID=2744474 RepID=UPI003FA7CB20